VPGVRDFAPRLMQCSMTRYVLFELPRPLSVEYDAARVGRRSRMCSRISLWFYQVVLCLATPDMSGII